MPNNFKLRHTRRGDGLFPPQPPFPELSPSLTWNGTAGSGGGAPTVTDRTTIPQPWCNELFVSYQTYAGDLVLAFQSGARDGLEKLTVYCEGNSIDITQPTWNTYSDANGVSRTTYGYHFVLKHATAMAISTTGTVNIWARAVPKNKPTFEDRVVGPFPFHPRAQLYDGTLQVGPGYDYASLKAALAVVSADYLTKRYRIMIMQSGDWKIDKAVTLRSTTKFWTTICAAQGVNAVIGSADGTTFDSDGTTVLNYTRPGINMMHFQGSNVKWELCKMSATMTGYYYLEGGEGNGHVWLDGIEITSGTPIGGNWSSGSGAYALRNGREGGQIWGNNGLILNSPNIYFTEVNMHDVSGAGMGYARLIRNSEFHRTSGTMMQTLGRRADPVTVDDLKGTKDFAIHGLRCSHMGGYDPDIRLALHNPGLTLTYSGSAAYVAFEKFNNNSNWQIPLQIIAPGSGYVDGVYGLGTKADPHIPFTGGTGTGAAGKITISGGQMTAVEIGIASGWGTGYTVGDIVSFTIPGGGSGAQIRICGNFRVWEGTDVGSAVVTNEHLIPFSEPLVTLVNKINTTWTNWSATLDETSDRRFATAHLSLDAVGISVSMGIPKREVIGSPKRIVLTTRMDIHSNILAFPAVRAENGSIWGLTAFDHMGGSPFSASGGLEDVGVENSSWNDIGYSLPVELGGPVGLEGGYQTGNQDHVVMRYLTLINCFWYGNPDSTRTNCLTELCYMDSHGAQAFGQGEIRNCVFLKAPKPLAADAATVVLGLPSTGVNDVFMDARYPNNNIIPKPTSTPGVYNVRVFNGKLVGRYLPNGDINGVKYYGPRP